MKTLKKKHSTVRKANARFDRMTPEQKRVAIAKDAIELIESDKAHIVRGHWASFGNMNEVSFDQKVLNKKNMTCIACALGLALVSSIHPPVQRLHDLGIG